MSTSFSLNTSGRGRTESKVEGNDETAAAEATPSRAAAAAAATATTATKATTGAATRKERGGYHYYYHHHHHHHHHDDGLAVPRSPNDEEDYSDCITRGSCNRRDSSLLESCMDGTLEHTTAMMAESGREAGGKGDKGGVVRGGQTNDCSGSGSEKISSRLIFSSGALPMKECNFDALDDADGNDDDDVVVTLGGGWKIGTSNAGVFPRMMPPPPPPPPPPSPPPPRPIPFAAAASANAATTTTTTTATTTTTTTTKEKTEKGGVDAAVRRDINATVASARHGIENDYGNDYEDNDDDDDKMEPYWMRRIVNSRTELLRYNDDDNGGGGSGKRQATRRSGRNKRRASRLSLPRRQSYSGTDTDGTGTHTHTHTHTHTDIGKGGGVTTTTTTTTTDGEDDTDETSSDWAVNKKRHWRRPSSFESVSSSSPSKTIGGVRSEDSADSVRTADTIDGASYANLTAEEGNVAQTRNVEDSEEMEEEEEEEEEDATSFLSDPLLHAVDYIEDEIDGHAYDDLVPLSVRLALEERVFGWSHLFSDIAGHVLYTAFCATVTWWVVTWICLERVVDDINVDGKGTNDTLVPPPSLFGNRTEPYYEPRLGLSFHSFELVRAACVLTSAVSSFRTVRRRKKVWLPAPYGSAEYKADRARRRRTVEETDRLTVLGRIRRGAGTVGSVVSAARTARAARKVRRKLRKAEQRFERRHRHGPSPRMVGGGGEGGGLGRLFRRSTVADGDAYDVARMHHRRVEMLSRVGTGTGTKGGNGHLVAERREERPVRQQRTRSMDGVGKDGQGNTGYVRRGIGGDSNEYNLDYDDEDSGSVTTTPEDDGSYCYDDDNDDDEYGRKDDTLHTPRDHQWCHLGASGGGNGGGGRGFGRGKSMPQSILRDQLLLPSGPIHSVPYAHGGFFGAAPFMLADPQWVDVLRSLMPDVYVEISRRVLSAPVPKLIHWAENNPVVAAYGTAHELERSGRLTALEWDVFLDPHLVRRVEIVLEERDRFLARLRRNVATTWAELHLADGDVYAHSSHAEALPPMATENDAAVLRYFNREVRKRTSILVDRMLIAHGNLTQLLLEQTGCAKHYIFSRVKRTRRTLGGGIFARQWLAVYAEALRMGTGMGWDDITHTASDSGSFDEGTSASLSYSGSSSVPATPAGSSSESDVDVDADADADAAATVVIREKETHVPPGEGVEMTGRRRRRCPPKRGSGGAKDPSVRRRRDSDERQSSGCDSFERRRSPDTVKSNGSLSGPCCIIDEGGAGGSDGDDVRASASTLKSTGNSGRRKRAGCHRTEGHHHCEGFCRGEYGSGTKSRTKETWRALPLPAEWRQGGDKHRRLPVRSPSKPVKRRAISGNGVHRPPHTSLSALALSSTPNTTMHESIDMLRRITDCRAPLGLVLDIKSRHVSHRIWALVVDALRDAGSRVEGIASFAWDEIRDISRYCASPVREIYFFHSAGDLQRACHEGHVRERDCVFFNAGSLIWDRAERGDTCDVWTAFRQTFCDPFDPSEAKRRYELMPYAKIRPPKREGASEGEGDRDCEGSARGSGSYSVEPSSSTDEDDSSTDSAASPSRKPMIPKNDSSSAAGNASASSSSPNSSTIQDYKERYNLSIGLYCQEFAVDDSAVDFFVRHVNENPHVYDLGLSWGGVNGITVRGIQPGRFTNTDGFWNQRYAGLSWDRTLFPPPSPPRRDENRDGIATVGMGNFAGAVVL